jgi:hypothetical protein
MRLVVAGVVLALASSPGFADDDPPPFTIGESYPAYFILGGVSTGYTVAGDRGAFVGGELSLVRLVDAHYLGLYADGMYDWGFHGAFTSGGVELGYKLIGLDGGIAMRSLDGTDVGFTGRFYVGAGVFALYFRYSHFDSMTDRNLYQVGALVKFPLHSPFGGRR